MREDMSRVIVERPRVGGGKARKGRRRAMDELPSHEGMRRPHMVPGSPKMLNENLSPFRRYLEKQVGRPWNKVYSEIASRLKADSTVQKHVLDHLKDFVAIRPCRRRYQVYVFGGGREQRDELWRQILYVDPKDGILKRTDRLPEARKLKRSRRPTPKPLERVPLAPDRELRCLKGVWYEIRLAPLPDPCYRDFKEQRRIALKRWKRNSRTVEVDVIVRRLASPGVIDAIDGALVLPGPETDDAESWERYRAERPDRRYAISKRQLSKVELRRHGIQNKPPGEAMVPCEKRTQIASPRYQLASFLQLLARE